MLPFDTNRTQVCVTGMHRSGTSMAMRAVQLLGVSLGDESQLLPPGSENPKGFFENRPLFMFDNDLLAERGGTWHRPPVLDDGWELDRSLDPFRERAAGLLASAFAADPDVPGTFVGWKDPRLCLLLPFWRTVTPIHATVVMVRDPNEVAASLAARNDLWPPAAYLLWLRYLLAALHSGANPLVVGVADLFERTAPTLASIAAHLGLPAPTGAVVDAVVDHLDRGLIHHRAVAPLDPANPIVALANDVWHGGRTDAGLATLSEPVVAAIRQGWLRSPDDADLAAARAQVAELTEELDRVKGLLPTDAKGPPQ